MTRSCQEGGELRQARPVAGLRRRAQVRSIGPTGDRLVLSAFGAGFTAGSVYLRWVIKVAGQLRAGPGVSSGVRARE